MDTPLQVYLLGPPVIQWAGESLVMPRRQVRGLLFRLAAETRPVSRGELACLFWGDLPESSARRNLSRLLVYLANHLPDSNILQVSESGVSLEQSLVWVDTRLFEAYWESWKLHHRCQDLQAAAGLYRGAFLGDFRLSGNIDYDRWTSMEGERWEQAYLRTLRTLTDECAVQGESQQAIDYARQFLGYNELAEDIHCRLIELYTAHGERSAALRQYELCSVILERELGVQPMPETRDAYKAALDQRAARTGTPAAGPGWTTLPGLHAPFIGRQEILGELSQALRRAQAGQGKAVLLRGEAGIGKSRLMQEFASRQRVRTQVISGSASPESAEMPYQLLIEALRPALSQADLLRRVPVSWLVEAARVLPELAELIHQPLPTLPMESGEARSRIFEGLYRILFSMCEGGTTVILCLDDLHWADATSLDFLAYLGRRLHGQRVLVLGSYRSEAGESLSKVRRSLARHAELSELSLEGLDDNETWRLVSSLGDEIPAERELAERLRAATDGNPFFILETLRALQESAVPGRTDDPGSFPIPDTVRQVINSRLQGLHPNTRQMLEAGAVIGQVFELESALMTAGRGEMEVLDGLDELVERQFLEEIPAGYKFSHAILREAVYAGLSRWRRNRLHRRAGKALEKLHPDETSALAWHYEQAGEAGKAAVYLLKTGQAARQIFAHLEARACYDRALTLLELEAVKQTKPEALVENHKLRIQALYERGWALRLLGQMEAYTQDLVEVGRLAQALGDPHTLAHLHWQEAYNHRWFCRYEQARAAAIKGVQHSQECGEAFLEAVCRRELGMAARETGDYAAAQANLQKALEIFSHLKNISYQIHTLGNLSTLAYRQGSVEKALQLAHQAMDICKGKNLQYERRLPLGDLGAARAELGETERSMAELEESLSISTEIADSTQIIFCQGHLGQLLIRTGRYSEALQRLEEALQMARQIGSLSEQSWLLRTLAEAYAGSGRFELAIQQAQNALEIAQACQRIPDVGLAQQLLEQLRGKEGEDALSSP